MSDPHYAELFPEARLFGKNIRSVADGSWLRNSDIFEIVDHKGIYRSAGIGGGITGMGANIAIIDDPIKDQKEADSPTFRQNVWDWYTSTLLTRLEKNAKIIITLTRWHEDDLAGRILAQPDHGFTVVSLPMIKEIDDPKDPHYNPDDPRQIGDPLWPEKYDLAACMKIKKMVGSRVWSALYQQRPTALEGGIFKRKNFKYWERLPDKFDEIIDSWDLPFKDTEKSDYAVGTKWGKKGSDFYLLKLVRDKMDFPAALQAVITLRNSRIPNAVIIEDKANGSAILSMIKDKVPGAIPFAPETSKEARAHAVTAYFEAGNVHFPKDAEWLEAYEAELLNFPRARHDDQVDSTTQALMRLAHFGNGDFTESMAQSTVKTIASSLEDGDSW